MRFKVAALVVVCLALAAKAQAHRFEVSPLFAISMPAGDISKTYDVGFSVGATATYWQDSTAGVGFDLAYHRWDASFPPYYVVTGSTSSVGIIQATAHVKHLVPMRGPVTPWIQVGAGLYHYKGGFAILGQLLNHNQLEFGFTGELGFDFHAVGADASYHYMLSRTNGDVEGYNAVYHIQFLTAGVHFRL